MELEIFSPTFFLLSGYIQKLQFFSPNVTGLIRFYGFRDVAFLWFFHVFFKIEIKKLTDQISNRMRVTVSYTTVLQIWALKNTAQILMVSERFFNFQKFWIEKLTNLESLNPMDFVGTFRGIFLVKTWLRAFTAHFFLFLRNGVLHDCISTFSTKLEDLKINNRN